METYARKIRKIKKSVKNYVVENSSLCDEVARIQNLISQSNLERDFLLRKLMEYEPQSFDFIQQSTSSSQNESVTKYKKRKNSDTNSEASEVKKKIMTPASGKKQLMMTQQANPRLPVILTNEGITILSYGKVMPDRPAYSSDRSIAYPIGYRIARVFNGSKYICRILDNGSTPLFEIFRESDPTIKFSGPTTDDVHCSLQMYESNSIIMPDGDKFFGFKNKAIVEYLKRAK